MIFDILTKIVSPVIDKIFPDKTEAAKAKARLIELQQSGELAFVEAQSKVLVAEANSESWITRSWRPITMLSFVFLINLHYFLIPFLNGIFGAHIVNLPLPDKAWGLMEIGIGGYIMGRSAVHGIKAWKEK